VSHLFLTGFMGAGKSTVGRLVAQRLGLPFVDVDALVEEREGRTIPAIFSESGEDAFRCAETDALALLAAQPDAVVACGGGIVLRDENRALLKSLGRVFYLVVTAEEALARLGDASGRPLLAGEAGRMATTLLDGRSALYRAVADDAVDTAGLSPDAVADEIVRRVRSGGPDKVTIRVEVPASPYSVMVGDGAMGALGACVRGAIPRATRVALVTDETVMKLLGRDAGDSLRAASLAVVRVEVPAGEASKSWQQAGEVLGAFASAGLERTDAVVALGGGVVGDLAGFCAAVFLRGVPVVQVPTTLLAQVDSSIGGKTGVDLPAGKNLVGAFWQPAGVVTDTSVLKTLPDTEWRSGLAEVAKSAVLAGEPELAWLEQHAEELVRRDPAAVRHAVEVCVRFKAGVVAADERESGRRECLNLGHTLGHAIEREAGFGVIPHGIAVAQGMRFAARLAETLGLADAAWTARVTALLDALGLPETGSRFNPEALHETMRSDKKVRAGRVRFALAVAPGRCEVCEVDDEVLTASLAAWAGMRG
jgi:shikimate kinase / 3-dehydroquinate synthase